MREFVLIHITGRDRPGVTARLTKALADCKADILDIGQSVIHDTLSLGLLVRIPPEAASMPVVKDLLFTAHELDLKIRIAPVGEEPYENWVEAQGKNRFILTLLGPSITAEHIHRITQVVAANGLNIDVITRLSGRPSYRPDHPPRRAACVEISLRGAPRDIGGLRKEFLNISSELGVDIAFQEDSVYRRNRLLVAFDMDSTLIAAEVIDELAKAAGVGREVAEITERAMHGEMDFKESLRQRLALLKGLPETALEKVAQSIPLTDGAERLTANLKRFGYKIAIISGGFTWFGNKLKERLGIDYVHANELEIKDGKLTGRVRGPIVDGPGKAEILKKIAAREGIDLRQVVAVGDGANDLPMLNLAGLGIAFHAKPVVKEGAGQSISTLGLDAILYLMGMRERDTLA